MTDSFDASPEADALIAKARAMIPVLRERAARHAADRRIAAETIRDLQTAGFFRVLQPKRWRGFAPMRPLPRWRPTSPPSCKTSARFRFARSIAGACIIFIKTRNIRKAFTACVRPRHTAQACPIGR